MRLGLSESDAILVAKRPSLNVEFIGLQVATYALTNP
jgi:hypothetical protein